MGAEEQYTDGSLEKALQEAKAAPADEVVAEEGSPAAEEAPEDLEEDDEDDEGVQEHLKDAVEGTLRLKRMLSHDDEVPEDIQDGKKRRKVEGMVSEEDEAKIKALLTKWGLVEDRVSRHVLEGLKSEELDTLQTSGHMPDKFNQWKSPPELLHMHIKALRERVGAGGGIVDSVAAFKVQWKLDLAADVKLRNLNHKDLRYVLDTYDGTATLDEVIEQAAATEADESTAAGSLPTAPGLSTIGRFNRLELIDPLADCAVFGDANLSFAVKLAKHRKALGHVGRVIATTFETLDCLRQRYPEIDDTIKLLEEHYAEVYHGVDCTRIAVDGRFKDMEGSLGAVYYNFPHAGAVSGFFDGHPCVNWRHENLMRLFFRALRSFVKPGGLVKVASSKGAVGVRYSYITHSGIENEFHHVETVPFLEWHLHRYGRSYGDKRDVYRRPGQGEGYNVQKAESDMVYTLQYRPTGENLPPQQIMYPPKFGVLEACTDGPFRSLHGEGKKALAKQLYKRFVTECSGEHVG